MSPHLTRIEAPASSRSDSHTSEGLEHLRDRVRLYAQVLLILDIISRVSDLITLLIAGKLNQPELPEVFHWIRGLITVGLAVTWAYTRFAQPGRLALLLLETGVSMGLAWTYTALTSAFTADVPMMGPPFGIIAVAMVILLRAAVVPSPTHRTVLMGLGAVGLMLLNHQDQLQTMRPIDLEAVLFMGGVFTLITAVISRVIYGLRRQVQDMTRLGQYTLEARLGEGGMGAVYRASHALLRREAAIKLIKPPADSEALHRAQQRFEREAQVTAGLKSPHTVQLYDFGLSENGDIYYVMELLEGLSLQQMVERYGPLPPARTVHLLSQVCASLAEAHQEGLVHRDIKPANLFLCRYGLHHDFVKVLDFGLVALNRSTAQADAQLTHDGAMAGTPAFMAPEMIMETSTIDARADLYALGAVAYWLLTGHTPFESRSAMAMMVAHAKEAPPPMSEVTELEIPAALEQVVMDCLAKAPKDRPASAQVLADRLAELALNEGWSEEKATLWWRRHQPRPDAGAPGAIRASAALDPTADA